MAANAATRRSRASQLPQCLAWLVLLAPTLGWSDAPPSTAAFAPGSAPSNVELEGHVRFSASGLTVVEHIRAPFLPPTPSDLPDIDVDLVQSGQDLLPARRGLVTTTHPLFDYFVGPGRVWSENGHARGSLPITLMYRDDGLINCAHNGLIGFTYTKTSIDDVQILVDQETCHFVKFDLWGAGRATYAPHRVDGAEAIRTAFAQERSDRIPTKPLAALATDYGADVTRLLGGLPRDDDLTTAGAYFEGTHYTNGCSTRSGPYPYCEVMLLTSFSTAKTAFPALVLMSLAERDGLAVYREKIADYVPEVKDSPGDWRGVTFDQVGDMTSGNFINGEPMADAFIADFYADNDRATKLAAALGWPNGAKAGTRFVYQTADTFILVNAIDGYLAKHREGRGQARSHGSETQDAFDYLVEHVLKPLHVAPDVLSVRRTREGGINNSGTPIGGMGLWWTADAIVKVARLMALDGGKIGDRQVLEPHALAAALQRDPNDRGVATYFFGNYYNNGTWAFPLALFPNNRFACGAWVPFMTGLSGVRVAMMPNGFIFYYFDDSQSFPMLESIDVADHIRPLCP